MRAHRWVGSAAAIAALALTTSAPVGGTAGAAVSGDVVVVTNRSDTANGDVSSVAHLNARPGPDGVSLREALLAADATRGTGTVYVMFSHALDGATIAPRTELPPIHRNHLVLEGIAPSGSRARVTIRGDRAPQATVGELLLVQASDVTIRLLRFANIDPTGNPTTRELAVRVVAGDQVGVFSSPGPPRVRNVQILDNVFDNGGITLPVDGPAAGGLLVSAGESTKISGVTIARNTFLHYDLDDADGVGVSADARAARVSNVVIRDNTFGENTFPIELSERFDEPRMTGVQIIGNTISGGAIGISVNTTNATNGVIDGTLIEANRMWRTGNAINVTAEAFDPAMGGAVGGDVVSDTRIVNNVIDGSGGDRNAAIYVLGGDRTASRPSRVSGLTLQNDTVVGDADTMALTLIPDNIGASGNLISGVLVRNTILYAPGGSGIQAGSVPVEFQAPDEVTTSLVTGGGWAGTNGNIDADPLFVDASATDYRLSAGSPCIDAGTGSGAPATDVDGRRRDATPDIGAHEYGAAPRPELVVSVARLGGSGVVVSDPAGVRCPDSCTARVDLGTTVTLTAVADTTSRFTGWTGACSGTGRCTLLLDGDTLVTGAFRPGRAGGHAR